MYFPKKYRYLVYGVSMAVGVLSSIIVLLSGLYTPIAPYMIPMDMKANYAFALCILVAITPPAIVEMNNNRWLQQVDKNIPRILIDITESIRSGMSLIKALEATSKRDYGPVSQQLEVAVVHFNLTSNLEESLNWYGDSLLRPSGRRMSTILMEASRSGGKMLDVLETSIQMFSSIDEYKEEKKSTVSPYVMMVYVSTLVFLFMGYIMISQFLGPLANQNVNIPGVSQLVSKMLPLGYYKSIIFWGAMIEGLIGGLVIGKISNSKVASGLIHSVTLILITYLFYNLLI
jgi:archaeal flagellar protein FlaJ